MYKSLFSVAVMLSLAATPAFSADHKEIGVINFTSCMTDSKYGKKEQENMESLRRQMTGFMESIDKERQELEAKFEDTEYLDSLSPQAEEELKAKYENLKEELSRSQQQFYQVLQQAHYQMMQKIGQSVTTAAEQIAKEDNLDYVLHKDACFFSRSGLDVTQKAIEKMDLIFEQESKNKKLSENGEQATSSDATLSDQAG